MNDTLSLGESMGLFTAPRGESIETAQTFTKSFGGAESNFAIALARLGFQSSWYSLLGQDALGTFILNTIQAEGVDTSHAELIPSKRTGVYYKSIAHTGAVTVAYDRAHSAFSQITPAQLDKTFIGNHRVLHLTGITACLSESCYLTAKKAMTYFKEAPSTSTLNPAPHIVFDINIRRKLWDDQTSQPRLLSLAKESTLVLGSVDEYNQLAAPYKAKNPTQAAKWAFSHLGVPAAIVKLDERGSQYFDRTETVYVPAFTVKRIVDPVGAGDAFAAGVVAAFLEHKTTYDALLQGNAMGALVLAGLGDTEPLPKPHALKTFIQTHKPKRLPKTSSDTSSIER